MDLTAAEFEQYAHQLEPYEVVPLSEPPPKPLPEPETETIVLEPPAEEPETEVEPETTAKRRRPTGVAFIKISISEVSDSRLKRFTFSSQLSTRGKLLTTLSTFLTRTSILATPLS